jgi:hypothetical protein
MIETVGAIMLATHDMAHAVSFYRALGFELRHGRHVSAFYADVVARGYRPDAAPRDAEWGERFFHLTDPDGHELSFARLCNDGDIRLRPHGQVDVSPGIAPATVRRCAVFFAFTRQRRNCRAGRLQTVSIGRRSGTLSRSRDRVSCLPRPC